MTLKDYNALRSRAATIRNWYLVNGEWQHLTRTEARQVVLSGKATSFRQATVDEELERDGI